ncbi:MYXO-CTERM domain-containing protein [Actinoplanes philippinensis]|uniref:histidine kinase n=1 Tax=Actinoplanes philippinensis TaxID=35752 RepID=A0A1I2FHR9_9ACTN|nr:histidine kinase [Actinoplanes philippinensis]SFF04287.1 MYXO-CTERM domain-containing protein [Actinoplanes philippinensis]
MNWAGRLLNARETLPRMLLLILSGVAYLLVICGTQAPPTGPQWLLAGLAFAAGLLLHRRQPVNLLVQTLLFGIALAFLEDPTINQVGTAWALGELAFWAPRAVWIAGGAGLVAVTYLSLGLPGAGVGVTEAMLGLSTSLGMPILLGLVGRTTHQLGLQAARRTESEQRAARADERAAIARELHDVVAHHIASVVLRVGVARHVLPDLDPRVTDVFDDVHRTGTEALTDLRQLVAVLRDPEGVRGDAALTAIEPSALPAALDGAVEKARLAGVIVEAEIDPAVGSLDAVRGLAVLRLTQEALTNVAKHAGPSATASLRVRTAGSGVEWAVVDDGGGPTGARDVPVGGGHGLTGMRERVEVLGGTLTAGPDGKGWRVSTVLPG